MASTATVCNAIFLTSVRTTGEKVRARTLIDSIRTFGGSLSNCPIWLFESDALREPSGNLESMDVQVFSLTVPNNMSHYDFAEKVWACAQAEEIATQEIQSLIWIDSACLIIKPPLLFDLSQSFDAAVRPVHVRNVGLPPGEPLDHFWKKIYETVGVKDIPTAIETFVDGRRIRSYFNSHAFAIRPSQRLLRQWFECFAALVSDREYQEDACHDKLHQVFLHQAVLSALLVAKLDPVRIHILPPNYNYPYNLHQSVPLTRRAAALNDLVCIAYEDRSLDPNLADDIDIYEPLRSWLSDHSTLK